MDKGLEPKAIENGTEPDEFVNRFFDAKAEFFIEGSLLIERIGVNVYKGEENVVLALCVAHQNRDDL